MNRLLRHRPTPATVIACVALIVALGGTAVRALLGPKVKVLVNRGKFFESEWGPKILVTVHPSSILRVLPEDREQAFKALVKDLMRIKHA